MISSRQLKVAIPLMLAAGFVVYLIVSSLGLNPVTCEVCVEFAGRLECRSAAGTSEQEAVQTGVQNACSLITSGRDELILCTSARPVRVVCTQQ